MPRKGTRKKRSAVDCANRDLQKVLEREKYQIDDIKYAIKDDQKQIEHFKRKLAEREKALELAEKALELAETKYEQSKETIIKNAEKVRIKVGQAIYHKKYGNCLVKDLRLTRTGKSVQAVLTGVEGGTYKVPHNQCIPFQDMTTAIFG